MDETLSWKYHLSKLSKIFTRTWEFFTKQGTFSVLKLLSVYATHYLCCFFNMVLQSLLHMLVLILRYRKELSG